MISLNLRILTIKMSSRVVHVLSPKIPNLMQVLTMRCPGITFKQIHVSKNQGFSIDVLTKLQEAEILISHAEIGPYVTQLPNLKWLQYTGAGINCITEAVRGKLPPSYIITRFGGVYGPDMAEYVVGEIIARERSFRRLWKRQDKHNWLNDVNYRKLSNLTLGILGLGDIGKEVAKYCKALGMTIWAMGQTPKHELPLYVDHFRTQSGLNEVLQSSDYICSILPSTPSTQNLLSGDVLQVCKPRQSVFINIGRGDVISEASLLKALKSGWIAGAILHVFEKEPLPKESELWDMPGVTVTPHCSAVTFAEDVAKVFAKNIKLYEEGKPMDYTVDITRGY